MANTWYFSLALNFLLLASIPSIFPDKSPAFFFFKHLQRCTKGETVKGLHQLKEYMMRFGYLNFNPNTTLGDLISTISWMMPLHCTSSISTSMSPAISTPWRGVPNVVSGTNYKDYHGKHRSGPKGILFEIMA